VVAGDADSRDYGDQAETRDKLSALRAAMFGADVDAVYLERWANIAWLCGGRGNRVVSDSPQGLCGILVGANGAWLLAPNNEEARLRAEPFATLRASEGAIYLAAQFAVGQDRLGEHGRFRFRHRRVPLPNFELDGIIFAHMGSVRFRNQRFFEKCAFHSNCN